MAIVNRTPDSFWSGNRHDSFDSALQALDAAVEAGADIIDVGGVRAGQEGDWVDDTAEIERVVPFLREARERHPQVLLSLDTWRASVARAAAGYVDLVNDTWAGSDPELATAAAELNAGYVVSHTGGLPPRTDPVGIRYAPAGAGRAAEDDAVVASVVRTLREGAERAVAAGVRPDAVVVDPTLDFGKTTHHSLAVLRATDQVSALGFPVLQALSRKDFVGETLDLEADDRLEGTLAATAIAAWMGTVVFRAHDVRATRRVVDMIAAIRGDREPAVATRGEPGDGPSTLLR
ncbi:dihydropteroate synthase [Calidifontibacter terrae]